MRLYKLIKTLHNCKIKVLNTGEPKAEKLFEGYANKFPNPKKWKVESIYPEYQYGTFLLIYVTKYEKKPTDIDKYIWCPCLHDKQIKDVKPETVKDIFG